jgi:hypothetical protein
MQFNFQFGKKKPDNKSIIIVSLVVTALISILSQCTHINQNSLWDIFDEVQRKFFPQTIFNELIIKDPEKLDRRVRRDVDHALEEYEAWERSLPPRMTNKTILKEIEDPKYSETQRLTVRDAIYYECPEGVMGIRGAWVDKDPNCQ